MSEFIGETPRPHRADVDKRARRDRVFLNNPRRSSWRLPR